MSKPKYIGILAVGCVLVFVSCSPNRAGQSVPSKELDEQLHGATKDAGFILVTDADGKYWLISKLAIQSINNNKISLQPYYGRLAVATGHGFTPREIADRLQNAIEIGGSPFTFNEGVGKQLSGETLVPKEPLEITVAAILGQCRFMGWGYSPQGEQPECSANEYLKEGRPDRQGTTYYCCTL